MKNSKFKIQNSALALGFGLISFMGFCQSDEYPYNELQIANYENELSYKNGSFIENLGQLGVFGQPGVQANNVEFYSVQPDFFDFVQRDRLSFVSAHSVDTIGVLYNVNRLDLLFYEDAGQEYKMLDPTPYLEGHTKRHFYTGLTTTGIENVREFGEIYFHNVYHDVDMTLSHNKAGLRALFRLQPGVDPGIIKLEFDGLTGLNFSGGNVNIGAYQSAYQFHKPVVYQIDNMNNISFLTADYAVDVNGRIFFAIPYYDPSYNVYISVKQGNDPISSKASGDNLDWSSYIGEVGNTTLLDVTTDDAGNVVYTGLTNYPNFLGAVGNNPLISFAGGFDAFMFQLNEDIEPEWYTFFGGDIAVSPSSTLLYGADDYASGIATDGQSFYLTGNTKSSNIPIVDVAGTGWTGDPTNSAIPTTDCQICEDIFYAKFNSNGILQYSTYFGEQGQETAYDILYRNSKIVIVGIKDDNTILYPKSGASNYTATGQNGLILEFDIDNNMEWATGFEVERITSSATNESGDLIVAGNTNYSLTLPSVNMPTGSNFNSQGFGTGKNGFIAVFNTSDVLTHTSYYKGTCGDDVITGLSTNMFTNKTYGVGLTVGFNPPNCLGSNDLPVLGNGLSPVAGHAQDHFYFNFSIPVAGVPLNFQNAGYYGGDGEELMDYSASPILDYSKPSIIAIPNIGFAITGATNSSATSIPVPFPSLNPINFYLETDKNPLSWSAYDAYVSVFDENAILKYTTYFGLGEYSEGGASLSYTNVNNANRLFFAGNTTTHNTPTMTTLQKLFTEEYNTFPGSNDYFKEYVTPGNYKSWGALLILDDLDVYLKTTENESITNVKVYPNPTSHNLTVTSPEIITSMKVYGLDGKIVLSRSDLNTTEQQVDFNGNSSGVYIIEVNTAVGVYNTKFQKL